VSVDTLRADRLGCYGYARDTSPALDRLAARAVRFERAIAESSWTLPSHVSLLSGLHPLTHGVESPELAPGEDVALLAELLAEAGWYTFAITDGGWLSEPWGFARGFASFHARDQDFADTVREALEYVRYRSERGPWFGFLHTYDVHCPYDPPEPWFSLFQSGGSSPVEVAGRCGNPHFAELDLTPGQVRYLSDRYDGGVRWMDDALAGLVDGLDELGALENTVLVVTSDHGEELGDHGRIGHERTLYREALAVPLLFSVPGRTPRTVDEPVGLSDVAPTLLELCGVAAPRGLDGRSLVPLLARDAPGAHGEEGVAADGRLSELRWKAELGSWIVRGEHLIVDRGRGEARLFDLDADPGEQHDLSAGRLARVGELRAELEARRAVLERGRHAARPVSAASGAVLERLQRLGY